MILGKKRKHTPQNHHHHIHMLRIKFSTWHIIDSGDTKKVVVVEPIKLNEFEFQFFLDFKLLMSLYIDILRVMNTEILFFFKHFTFVIFKQNNSWWYIVCDWLFFQTIYLNWLNRIFVWCMIQYVVCIEWNCSKKKNEIFFFSFS